MSASNRGRTIFDILADMIQRFGYAVLLAVVLLVFVCVWSFTSAKECERVSVWWGMVDYTKDGCKPAPAPTQAAQSVPQTEPSRPPQQAMPVRRACFCFRCCRWTT